MVALCLLTGLVYANSLGGAFIWDDEYFYLENPRLMKESFQTAFGSDLFASFAAKERYYAYRPLALLSYSWLARLFGVRPFGLHLASVVIHAAAGVLAFLLVLELAEIQVAWWAAALFLVHPIHVEAVAWMSAFPEVLAGALMLLSLYALLRARRGLKWLTALSYAAATLAFLTKETAFALPLLGVLLAGWRAWPLVVLAGASLGLRFTALGLAASAVPPRSLWGHISIMGDSALLYARHLLWPWPMAPEYELFQPSWIWVVFAALCAFAGWLAFRDRQLRIPLLCVLIPLSPALASSIIMPALQLARDRNAYVAVLGLTLLIGYALNRNPRSGAVLGVVLLALWSTLSEAAVRDWRDPETFWSHALEATPRSKYAVLGLGEWYYSTKRFAEADRVYEHGLRFRPGDPQLLQNREGVRRQMGLPPLPPP